VVLRVSRKNSRYFEDSSGKTVFLAGSHTWVNFRDYISSDADLPFDYTEFLGFLRDRQFNYIRLWQWELPNGPIDVRRHPGVVWRRAPYPWPRTGPGNANDGLPKFDLFRFDEQFFERMRTRVIQAGEHGVYVAVMLFGGVEHFTARISDTGFPFEQPNNVNGIVCGGLRSQTILDKKVLEIQEKYVKKVIDTVNDLDNVLYEIANEAGPQSIEWQNHMIAVVKSYEATKPKQHPVGMSWVYDAENKVLFSSDADWISPSRADGYGYPSEPPVARGDKVIINDTDHSFYYIALKAAGHDGQREWVWKNFTRGNNLAFMDPYVVEWPGRNAPTGKNLDPYWDVIRDGLSHARQLAERVNIVEMRPLGYLASTGYCLANPSEESGEYIVYVPTKDSVTVDLSATPGVLSVEWIDTRSGVVVPAGNVEGGAPRTFAHQATKDAVLHLRKI